MNIIVYFIVLFCLISLFVYFLSNVISATVGINRAARREEGGLLTPTNPTHMHSLDFLDKVPKSRPLHFL